MNLRRTLNQLVQIIMEEADRTPEFKEKLLRTLGQKGESSATDRIDTKSPTEGGRPKNRRMAAILDPVELVASGEQTLRRRLASLSVDQLQDIVSEYGMDPGRLVAKWKTPERIIDRIVEMAVARAQKGDAFRSES